MAARNIKIRHDENTRAKIQASQLINRLMDHVLGKVEMGPSQVAAALGLLKKTLPDLSAVEMAAEVTNRTVSNTPLTTDEWAMQYGNPTVTNGKAH